MRQQWRNERALLPVGGRSSVSFFFPNKNMTRPHIKRLRIPPKLDVLPVCFCCKFLTLHPEYIENRLLSVNDHRGFYVYKKKRRDVPRWVGGDLLLGGLLRFQCFFIMKSALNLRLFSSFSLSFFRVCFFSGEEDGRGNKSRRKEERNNSWHQHSGRRKPIAPNSSNQVLQRKFSLLLNFCIHCISASLPPAKSSHSIQQFPLILKNNNSSFNHTTIRNAQTLEDG